MAKLEFTHRAWPRKDKIGDPTVFEVFPQPLAFATPEGDHHRDEVFPLKSIKQSDWDAAGRGEQFLMLEWAASYDNGFGTMIARKGCLSWAFLSPVVSANKTVFSFNWGGLPCGESFDSTMTEALRDKQKAERQRKSETQ